MGPSRFISSFKAHRSSLQSIRDSSGELPANWFEEFELDVSFPDIEPLTRTARKARSRRTTQAENRLLVVITDEDVDPVPNSGARAIQKVLSNLPVSVEVHKVISLATHGDWLRLNYLASASASSSNASVSSRLM